MKFLAGLMVMLAAGAGLPLGSQWLRPVTHALAPPSRAVSPVTPTLLPPSPSGSQPPALSAAAAYAVDAATMTPLLAKNAAAHRPVASLTKLMNAAVIIHDLPPNKQVTVGQLPAYAPEDATVGLVKGERFTVDDLLKALLIPSGDDAADALALADAGSLPRFSARMNQLAAAYGLRQSHFTSASGLEDEGNYSSAHDLATLAKIIMTSPALSAIVATQHASIADSAGRRFDLATTDDLLATGQFSGIKTGYTQAAGQCFVGLTTINGHRVITVVLGSADRFGDTQALRDWIGRNWQWP